MGLKKNVAVPFNFFYKSILTRFDYLSFINKNS